MRTRDLVGLLLVAALGCQPASRYSYTALTPTADPTKPDKPTPPTPPAPPPLDPALVWYPSQWSPGNPQPTDVPIVFVSEAKAPARWASLPRYWNPPPLTDPVAAASLIGDPLDSVTRLVALHKSGGVEVKVPRGLDDPTPLLPAENPPTLGAWLLGRRLFTDPRYLVEKQLLSCATCHDPGRSFSSRQTVDGTSTRNTLGLHNVVYQRDLFWDGRAKLLEESLQQFPEDERAVAADRRHAWPGAITRLRSSSEYVQLFRRVYGAYPNQDNVARALATYLRTILAGNSLHDRAVAEAKAAGKAEPDVAHYAKALTDADLAGLQRPNAKPEQVAEDLHRGYLLYHDKVGPRPTACAQCHGGPLFTNRGFHNLNVEPPESIDFDRGRLFAVPPGRRTAADVGAYRTPSLRDVDRTAPYFHNGRAGSLEGAVRAHLEPTWGSFLDPLFLEPDQPANTRKRPLPDGDLAALLLFLRALNSEPPPAIFAPPL